MAVILPDWRHADAHIRDRRGRKGQPGETDIDPQWANEAYSDREAVWFIPDPKGRKGMSNRTVGWSETAGFVITVITARSGRLGVRVGRERVALRPVRGSRVREQGTASRTRGIR
ncbi:hypothetical protein ACH436_17460 [Isoptericola sp. NPDC019693]|uniref:hypothetical protein n=1 Tax=Isoptericola sp. NPDC019693 TaxID=3364009 RepID=UPI00379FF782